MCEQAKAAALQVLQVLSTAIFLLHTRIPNHKNKYELDEMESVRLTEVLELSAVREPLALKSQNTS